MTAALVAAITWSAPAPPRPTGFELEFEVAPPSPAPKEFSDVRSAHFMGFVTRLLDIKLQS